MIENLPTKFCFLKWRGYIFYLLDRAQKPWESHKPQNQTLFQSWEGGKRVCGWLKVSPWEAGILWNFWERQPLRNNYMGIFTSWEDPCSSNQDLFSFCGRNGRKKKSLRALSSWTWMQSRLWKSEEHWATPISSLFRINVSPIPCVSPNTHHTLTHTHPTKE